ncbi:GMP reductase 2 [Emydura macquarii macquarii]|uniref:GMP reductase 2 n=1 Tax=Emydura macquarii macquarii TaxID=1129001 RepID=UPI00352B47B6
MPHIDNDTKLDFKDVLLRPKRSTLKSRSEVDLIRSFTFRNSRQTYRGIPVIAANMDTIGTFEMAKVLCKFSLFTAIHKHYALEEWKEFAAQNPDCLQHVAASAGTSPSDFEQLEKILEALPQVRYICLDVANGYSEHFVHFLRDVRRRFPDHTIMAGNVVTGEMVEELILSGADIIKVGIGSGSVCTTRQKTGVGYPQLSAVLECADAAHGLNGHIISDGGCSCPGDVAKAFGAGADFVMLGGMLAGHAESGGQLIERGGRKYKLFYGMSSEVAMGKYAGGVAEYRASEGRAVEVPFRGAVRRTVQDVLGGLRSTCTYVGAGKLKELSRRATFIRVTPQSPPLFGAEDWAPLVHPSCSSGDPPPHSGLHGVGDPSEPSRPSPQATSPLDLPLWEAEAQPGGPPTMGPPKLPSCTSHCVVWGDSRPDIPPSAQGPPHCPVHPPA